MNGMGKALLTGLCLSAVWSTGRAQVPGAATEAYLQGHWSLAVQLLQPLKTSSEAQRMLALAYYHNQDFDLARPALEQALAAAPGDVELNVAMLEVLLADRDYARASAVANRLDTLGAADEAAAAALPPWPPPRARAG